MGPWLRVATLSLVLVVLVAATGLRAAAQEEGTNSLVFAPVAGSPSPDASGAGVVEYKGGTEPRSKWTATFRFDGLRPTTAYSVVVQGRFGDDGSTDAEAFSELCSFHTDAAGNGGCWWYFRGLRRLDIVQLRLGDADGRRVLQATRGNGGPGSITSVPNRYSPTEGGRR